MAQLYAIYEGVYLLIILITMPKYSVIVTVVTNRFNNSYYIKHFEFLLIVLYYLITCLFTAWDWWQVMKKKKLLCKFIFSLQLRFIIFLNNTCVLDAGVYIEFNSMI